MGRANPAGSPRKVLRTVLRQRLHLCSFRPRGRHRIYGIACNEIELDRLSGNSLECG